MLIQKNLFEQKLSSECHTLSEEYGGCHSTSHYVMYYDMIFALLSTNQMEKSKPINTCTTLTYYLTINNKQVLWFLSKTAVNEEHILDLQSILIHVCTIYLS